MLSTVIVFPGCNVPSDVWVRRAEYGDVNDWPAGTIQNVTTVDVIAPFPTLLTVSRAVTEVAPVIDGGFNVKLPTVRFV